MIYEFQKINEVVYDEELYYLIHYITLKICDIDISDIQLIQDKHLTFQEINKYFYTEDILEKIINKINQESTTRKRTREELYNESPLLTPKSITNKMSSEMTDEERPGEEDDYNLSSPKSTLTRTSTPRLTSSPSSKSTLTLTSSPSPKSTPNKRYKPTDKGPDYGVGNKRDIEQQDGPGDVLDTFKRQNTLKKGVTGGRKTKKKRIIKQKHNKNIKKHNKTQNKTLVKREKY